MKVRLQNGPLDGQDLHINDVSLLTNGEAQFAVGDNTTATYVYDQDDNGVAVLLFKDN